MKGVLNVCIAIFFISSGFGQKIYWKSNYGKMNQPVGGIKEAKEMVLKEFFYPISALKNDLEGSVSIHYSLNRKGETFVNSISGIEDDSLRWVTLWVFNKLRFTPNNQRPFAEASETFSLEFSKKNWVKLKNKRGYAHLNYSIEPIDTSQKLFAYQLLKEKPYPIFTGKEKYNGFNDYIVNKLEFPAEALKLNLRGEVVVTFVIEQSGNISNVQVLKTMPAGCTEEALRLIRSLKWYPGTKNGEAVRTLMVSSIGFGVKSNTFQGAFNQGNTGR